MTPLIVSPCSLCWVILTPLSPIALPKFPVPCFGYDVSLSLNGSSAGSLRLIWQWDLYKEGLRGVVGSAGSRSWEGITGLPSLWPVLVEWPLTLIYTLTGLPWGPPQSLYFYYICILNRELNKILFLIHLTLLWDFCSSNGKLANTFPIDASHTLLLDWF